MSLNPDLDKLCHFLNTRIPDTTIFHIPHITSDQVVSFIQKLDISKATGIDGLRRRIIKLAAQVLSPSIALLINKSIYIKKNGKFPTQLKSAKVIPIFKG